MNGFDRRTLTPFWWKKNQISDHSINLEYIYIRMVQSRKDNNIRHADYQLDHGDKSNQWDGRAIWKDIVTRYCTKIVSHFVQSPLSIIHINYDFSLPLKALVEIILIVRVDLFTASLHSYDFLRFPCRIVRTCSTSEYFFELRNSYQTISDHPIDRLSKVLIQHVYRDL